MNYELLSKYQGAKFCPFYWLILFPSPWVCVYYEHMPRLGLTFEQADSTSLISGSPADMSGPTGA